MLFGTDSYRCRMKRKDYLQLAVALALVASACGGGADTALDDGPQAGPSSTDDAPTSGETVVIDSPDGFASIEIDPSSLPDGVSINDVNIVAAINDTDDETLPFVAARLEPHGTVLSSPATVRMTIPGPPPAGIMTIHQSGNFIQFVESSTTAVDGTTTIATELSSFSVLSNYPYSGLSVEVVVSPNPVTVQQQQTAVATVTFTDVEQTVTLAFGTSEGTMTVSKFTLGSPLWEQSSADFTWPGTGDLWSPTSATESWDGESSSTISVSSVCVEANGSELLLWLPIHLTVLVEGIEEVSAIPDLFAGLFDTENPDQPINLGENQETWQALEDTQLGDDVPALASLRASTATSCIDPSTATAPPIVEGMEAAQPTSLVARADGTAAVDFAGDFETMLKSGEFHSVVLELHSSNGPDVTTLRLTHDAATGDTAATVSENGLVLDVEGTVEFFANGSGVFPGRSDGPLLREDGFHEIQIHIIEEPGGEIFTQVLKPDS